MIFLIKNKIKHNFLRKFLFLFSTLLFTASLPVSAEYEQSLDELREKLGSIQENEELDEYLLQAYSGDKDAQFKLGALYSDGESGVPQDHEQAVYWYKKAAKQGHDSAQYNLGHKYLEGKGVEKDINQAIEWWKKAAKQQHELAQFNLGRAYYLGIGTKQDEKKSRYWFTQAANNNEVRSMAILKKMNWDTPQMRATQNEMAKDKDLDQKLALDKETENHLDGTSTRIAIYTNPVIKPLVITVAKSKQNLNVLTEQGNWLKITSKIGLPVWTHQDFISINGKSGTMTGSNVNARSVPIITRGSIVGRLNKGEKVRIIEQKEEWVRVVSPNRFKAWIKKQDYHALPETSPTTTPASKPAEKVATKIAAKPEKSDKANKQKPNDYKTIDSYYDKIQKAPTILDEGTSGEKKENNNKWEIK